MSKEAELLKSLESLCTKILEHYTHDGLQLMKEFMSIKQDIKDLANKEPEKPKNILDVKPKVYEKGPFDDDQPGIGEPRTGRGQAAPAPTKPIPPPLEPSDDSDLPF